MMVAVGNIYFAWVDAGTTWNSVTHARQDEDVFYVEISESEGDFPKAIIEARNPGKGLLSASRKKRCFISAVLDGTNTLLFAGRVTGAPSGAAKETIRMEFIARPDDWQTVLAAKAQELRVLPYYDPLFVAASSSLSNTEPLEGRAALYNWNRATNALTTTSILGAASPTIALGGTAFEDTIEIEIGAAPRAEAKVSVTVEWNQVYSRAEDISQRVLAAFGAAGEAGVCTLFPESLTKTFPTTDKGQPIELGTGTGYSVTHGKLEQIEAPAGASAASGSIWGSKQVYPGEGNPAPLNDSATSVVFKKFYYKAEAVLAYTMQQRRREVLTFTLTSDLQDITKADPTEDDISYFLSDPTEPVDAAWRPSYAYVIGNYVMVGAKRYRALANHTSGNIFATDFTAGKWSLQSSDGSPIGSKERGGFFLTDRGKQSIQHALLRARSELSSSARCISISFETDFGSVATISCRDTLSLTSSLIPGGAAQGKVTSYTLSIDGDSGDASARVTIGCCPGAGDTYTNSAGDGSYGDAIYDGGAWQQLEDDELVIEDIVYKLPTGGPQSLPESPIVGITVENASVSQESALRARQYPANRNLHAVLAKFPTTIKMNLKELTGASVLEYDPIVTISYPMPVRCEIDLEAS